MLERDIITKKCPQRWQDLSVKDLHGIDVVVCFEDRIFDIVLEDLQLRVGNGDWKPIHLICLDTKDTPEHAKVGGKFAVELCQAVRIGSYCCFLSPLTVLNSQVLIVAVGFAQIDRLKNVEEEIIGAIEAFESRRKLHLLYAALHI